MFKIYKKDGITLNTKDKYCTENIEVAIDTTDLTPENIVKGKRILGVDGTAEGGLTPTGTLEITTNGDHDVTNYATASVNVPPTSGIIPSGTVEIGKNGIYDITTYKYADVEIYPNVQAKSVTPTKELQTIQPDEGYDALNRVYVDPIPSEYIIPEGNINITENGAIDIKNYATATINVEGEIPEGYILPTGNFEITQNGNYNISDKETVSVNVATGGGDSLWSDMMDGRNGNWDYLLAYSKITDATPYLTGYDNPSSVKNMCNSCSDLTTLPLFDTSKITSMSYSFAYCRKLKSVPDYNTSNVTAIDNVFYGAGLEVVPNWDTSKVQNFQHAFYSTQIEEAVVNTDSATNINYIFQNCNYLKRVEISSMDKITSTYNASSYAQKCYNLRQFIIRNATKIPIFYNSQYGYPFTECYHMLGTFHKTYNPEAVQDGGIYVPDEWVEPMKAATGWSMYGDIIYPISELPESMEPTIPYITMIDETSSPWKMTTDKYYYSDGQSPKSKFMFTVPENATSTSLTFEVTVTTDVADSNPYWVLFGKLDTEVTSNSVGEEVSQDYRTNPQNITYTVTYDNLTAGEHFIWINAYQRRISSTTTQYLKFRRIYE